jgi:hypothetical protein
MTSDEFRKMALALPGAVEGSHMGHPDFRANGKIFATLQYPDENWGMVKLTPELQDEFVRNHPKAFVPANGAWGRQGSTTVLLKEVAAAALRQALNFAWKQAQNDKRAKRSPTKAAEGSRRRAR